MSEKDGIRSPEGMVVIASTREEPKEPPRAAHDEIRAIAASAKQRKFPCGHRGPKLFDLDLFGEVLQSNGKSPDKCGDCFAAGVRRSVCRCSLCGRAIWPGEGVALYGPSNQFKTEWNTEVASGSIGCLRMDCCPSGGFFAGHWTGQGFKPAFGDGATAVEQAIRTGQDVYVADAGDLDCRAQLRPSWFRRLWDRLRGR